MAESNTPRAAVMAVSLLSPSVCLTMQRAIDEADGCEVFFLGRRSDGSDRIDSVEVLARGHRSAVPALMSRAAKGDVALHNHPSGELLPSDADLEVAGRLAEAGTGFYIVNNTVSSVRVVVPIPNEARRAQVSIQDLEAVLSSKGSIADKLPGYERRQGQVDMARGVAAALNEDKLFICEAGTGTGKTFAYLVPAILWAVRNKQTVVVSTGTINLQEQIREKDIPFLQQGFLPEFKAVLVKGRGNYVSLRRAKEAGELPPEAFDSEDEQAVTRELVAWALKTGTGDRSELSPQPLSDAWERVESQSDNCLGGRCPTYKSCHYYRTRREANQAQILIVNHHLLFADLAAKYEMGSLSAAAVLPKYDRVIVDEAHKLEEIASAYFGTAISEFGLQRRLGRLVSRGRKKKGLVAALFNKLGKLKPAHSRDETRLATAVRVLGEDLPRLTLQSGDALLSAFEIGRSIMRQRDDDGAWRLRGQGLEEPERSWQDEILQPLVEGRTRLALLAARGQVVLENLDEVTERVRKPVEGLIMEFQASLKRLTGLAESVDHVLQLEDASHVRWFEVSGRRRLGTFRAAPLKIAPLLREALWDRLGSGVLTSATLTTDSGFDFIAGQLGLDRSERLVSLAVESPFDYQKQAVLAVPIDHSGVKERGFIDDTCYAIDRLTELSRGRCFVLFTSYRMLSEVYQRVEGVLRKRGLVLFKQGERSRRDLLSSFKSTAGAVLFGTDSFWEGVDVPGDQLSLVIVAKLPFRVPSDPLWQARAEKLEEQGGNAFQEMMLPEAILRLRQGFGRLIRTRQDRGMVVILDHRVLTRSYGHRVLSALPPVERCFGPFLSKVLRRAERAFGTPS